MQECRGHIGTGDRVSLVRHQEVISQPLCTGAQDMDELGVRKAPRAIGSKCRSPDPEPACSHP